VSGAPEDGGASPRQDVDHDLIAQAEDPYGDRYSDKQIYGQIHKSQRRIPWWLVIMVGVVILFSVVLNAPFLTGSGGHPLSHLFGDGPVLDVGMLMALIYVGGGFVAIFWYTFRRGGS